ncbi:NADPH-dependent FMN reductase [Streptomyces malaysiense]|uniref:NADPH-dependent FMN reductase n=1 Tax=Streptomyces malaysiense TaxID=1428626 RepID=A0A1J4PTG9_9ACTN|nr:NADPH-dependent FMN reductase [Streptomyces malaysiense]OIK24010.1 NADPH-dependent FMN reductase [Streptomyces malaysiense]
MILLLSGSLRAGSTNEALLLTARAVAAEAGVRTLVYDGLGRLPHFNPDDDREPLPPAVTGLRAAIDAADGVLICTPEYAGSLPGAFKNLLDWTVGGTEICDKPVAWVNVAAPGRGRGAEATLRTVLGYTGAAVVEAACVRVPMVRGDVGEDGAVADPEIRRRVGDVLGLLVAAGAGAA